MYRIFIVEDENEIAQSVQALLEQWGLQVHCATHFDDILTQFTACDPHLVLLDISCRFITDTTGVRKSENTALPPSSFSPPPQTA